MALLLQSLTRKAIMKMWRHLSMVVTEIRIQTWTRRGKERERERLLMIFAFWKSIRVQPQLAYQNESAGRSKHFFHIFLSNWMIIILMGFSVNLPFEPCGIHLCFKWAYSCHTTPWFGAGRKFSPTRVGLPFGHVRNTWLTWHRCIRGGLNFIKVDHNSHCLNSHDGMESPIRFSQCACFC